MNLSFKVWRATYELGMSGIGEPRSTELLCACCSKELAFNVRAMFGSDSFITKHYITTPTWDGGTGSKDEIDKDSIY